MPVDITALLKDWGVTLGLLSIAATALSVLLVLSLREFSLWFFRIGRVIENQNQILSRIAQLESQIKAQETKVLIEGLPVLERALPPIPGPQTEAKAAPTFQLHN
jgi:hypothetical protein